MTVSSSDKTITLPPSYNIPIALIVGSITWGSLSLMLWGGTAVLVASVVAVFGLFLLYQAATLRLVFTTTALDIYRGEGRIRQFPYQEWETWNIFWSPIPILFYFREVNSIHFLPILFSPERLRAQLEQRVPNSDETD